MSDLALNLRIRVNADGSVQVLNQTSAGLDRISNSAGQADRHITSLTRTLTTAAAAAASAFSMGKVVSEIGSFEAAMINVHALSKANAGEMMALESAARALGATTAFNAQQAAAGQGVLAAAGLKVNEILAATPQILELASAGQLDMARTGEIAIGTMRGLGLELSDLGRISDVATKTAADTFANVGDIGDAMKTVSPIAHAFGIDLEDMSAAIGILADNQIKGSEAGNNFKAMLVALGSETKEKTALLTQHGVAYKDLDIQTRGLTPVMETLRKAHLSGAEAITLFGGDAAAAGLILSSNAPKLGAFSGELDHAAGSAKTMSDEMNTGLLKALDAFGGVVSEAILQLGDDNGGGLRGGMTGLVQTATGVISIYEGLGDKFAESNRLNQEQYTHLKAVAGELEMVAGAAGGIAALTASIWAANVAMGVFNLTTRANPLILIATTAAAGIGAVIGKIHAAKNAHEDFMKSATTVDEANLKVKQQIAKINAIVPVQGAGHGATDAMITAAKAELEVLVKQRSALEEKAAATQIAADADKKAGAAAGTLAVGQTVASATTAKLTDGAKKAADEAKRKADAIIKGIADEIRAQDEQLKKLTMTERAYKDYELGALHMTDAVKASELAKWDLIKAAEAEKKGIEAGKSAMDAEIDRYNKLTLSAHDYFVEKLKAQGVAPDKIPAISALHDKSDGIEKSIAAAKTYSDELKNITRSTQDLAVTGTEAFDIFNKGFGSLSSVFDSVTKSIDKASAAIEDNSSKAADADKNQNYSAKQKADLAKAYAAEDKKLQTEKTIAELRGGRQLAEATSKMFGEKTAAAQGFHNLALVLGAAEMAMEAKKIVVYVAGIIPKVAAGAATMFAQSGWGGFAGVAAMAAIMAGLGYAAFSGGGSSAPPVMSSDTGTVLGDSTAKSESIDKTYDLLKSIHAEEYVELRGINKGISDLRNGITDTVTRIFQAGGVKDFASLAPAKLTGIATMNFANPLAKMGGFNMDPIGNFLGSTVGSFLFGGKQTQSVTQQGISTLATAISTIMDGADLIGRQFAVVETKTKGGLFTKTKTSYSTQYAELDADTQKAMTKIFKSVGDTMLGLADSLGEGLSDRVKNYIIPALTIDLKGLTGEDATKKLSGVISTALDTMADVVFGDILGQYQQLGEGMLETAIRIVSEVAVVKDALSKSGLSLASNALYIADTIAKAAGSLEEFQKQFGTYFDKFYTDAEKQADLQNRLLTVLDGSLATSRDGYRQQIEALDLTNEKDLARYSLLIKMAGAADQYYSALEAAAAATDALLKTLSDDVTTARNNLTEAYKNESAALTATIDKFEAFSKSLKNFRAGLLVGDLSTGTPEDKYLAAKYQFNSTLNKVKAGAGSTDASKAAYELALSDIQNKASAFLSASRDFNASGEAYKTDFNSVLSAINKGIIGADAAKTDAQNQLTVLNKSVEGLITINKSVLSVKDAIVALGKAVGYEQATKDQIAAKALRDSTALTEAASRQKLDAGIARAGADERAASEAGAKAAALKSFAPAPTTYISGQTNNPIWEQVLGAFNAQHAAANHGKPMDRPWTADRDAASAYQALVGQYNALSISAYETAKATAIGLRDVATASAKLIPALTATWTADKTAADNALAAYSTATALANAAKPVADSTKTVVSGSHRTGLSRVPFDGYIAELHKDERVLTAEESANYHPAQQRVEIAITRPAWLDNLTIKPGAASTQTDTRMVDALQKTIDELKEQNKHLRASVNVLQAGFTKLIQQNDEQAEHLEDIGKFTKRAFS